jgi:hypothetical protein
MTISESSLDPATVRVAVTTPSGDAWSFLNLLARADARIREIKNDGPRGVFNQN